MGRPRARRRGNSRDQPARCRGLPEGREGAEGARRLSPALLPRTPPDFAAKGVFGKLREAGRLLKRFRKLKGKQAAQLIEFCTGSLGAYLDRHFESDEVKRLFLANNVYGKHGGPYEQGSAVGLLFHLLSGGDDAVQGFAGHVIGGMGAITRAIAAERTRARRVEIATERAGRSGRGRERPRRRRRAGQWRGDPGRHGPFQRRSRSALSSASLMPEHLPEDFRRDIAAIKMAGPSAKLNLALTREPTVIGRARRWTRASARS